MDDWDAIYVASEVSTGEKIATEQSKQAARDGLSWELYKNLKTISDLFPRDPDKIRLYSNQGLLGIPEPTGVGDGGTDSSSGPGSLSSTPSSSSSGAPSSSSSSSGMPSSSSSSSGGPSSSSSSSA